MLFRDSIKNTAEGFVYEITLLGLRFAVCGHLRDVEALNPKL